MQIFGKYTYIFGTQFLDVIYLVTEEWKGAVGKWQSEDEAKYEAPSNDSEQAAATRHSFNFFQFTLVPLFNIKSPVSYASAWSQLTVIKLFHQITFIDMLRTRDEKRR